MKPILLFCTTGLGDFINLTPLIKKLKMSSSIEIVVDRRRGFFEEIKKWSDFSSVNDVNELESINLNKYSKIIFSIYSEFTTPKKLVQLLKKRAYFIRDVDNKYAHEIMKNLQDSNIDLAIKPFFRIDKKDLDWVSKKAKKNMIVVAPGCNNTARWIKKRWSENKWIKLSENLRKKGFKVIFIGRKTDYSEKMLGKIKSDFIDIGLGKTAALIKRSKFFIGINNGLSHLAAALKIPSIILFGPADAEKDRPCYNSIVIQKINSCKYCPCLKKGVSGLKIFDECDNQKCMNAIRVNDVVKIVNNYEKTANKRI